MKITVAINALFLTTILFMLLFVGNAKINDFYLFYFIIIFVSGLILFNTNKTFFTSIDLINLFILGVFFIHNLYSNEFMEYENYEYYFWPLNAIFLYLILIFYTMELNNKFFIKISLLMFVLFFYLLISPSIIDFFTLDTPRYSFIFGPNMYYRVLSILLILILYLVQKISNKIFLTIIFLLIPYIIALLHTGSRGALFTIVIVLLYFMRMYMKLTIKTIVFVSLLAISSLVFYIISNNMYDTRLLLLDYSNGSSIGVRLTAYIYAYEHFFELLLSIGMTGSEFDKLLPLGDHFYYPHNFILELFYYYGFIGFISIILIFASLFLIFTHLYLYRKNDYAYLIYILIILLLSASFSGDFNDNYSLLSILLILVRVLFIKNKST